MPKRLNCSDEQIAAALVETAGMVTAAAKLLGISARTLSRRLKGRRDLRPLQAVDPVWQRAREGSLDILHAPDPRYGDNTPHELYQARIDFDEGGARVEPRVLTSAELEDVMNCVFGQKVLLVGPLPTSISREVAATDE